MALVMTQGPSALAFENQVVEVTCTDALSKGNLVEFTLASEEYTACTKSTAALNGAAVLMGIALADVAAGAKGNIGVRGQFAATCDSQVVAGNALMASGDHAGNLDVIAAPAGGGVTTGKIVGIALGASASDIDLTQVLFDGITGFSSQSL
jgi:hypothetical protein